MEVCQALPVKVKMPIASGEVEIQLQQNIVKCLKHLHMTLVTWFPAPSMAFSDNPFPPLSCYLIVRPFQVQVMPSYPLFLYPLIGLTTDIGVHF